MARGMISLMTRTKSATARYCRRCGYDLRMSDTRCPVCGRVFDPANPHTTRRRPFAKPWLRHLRHSVALLTFVLLLAAVWGWFLWGQCVDPFPLTPASESTRNNV